MHCNFICGLSDVIIKTFSQSVSHFLSNFNRLCASILYRFRDIASYLSKVADFNPPHLHLVSAQGLTTVEFDGDLWRRKTRVTGLL